MPNCNSSDLSVYSATTQSPWNAKRVQHLHKRLGFNLSKTELDLVLLQTPSDYIENLFTQVVNLGSINPPAW